MVNGLFGVASPFPAVRIDPDPLGEPGGLQVFVFEFPAGSGEEAVHGGFVDDGAFPEAFALDGPVVSFMGEGDEVNARIATAQLYFSGEFTPHPDIFKPEGVFWIGFEVGLHQALKTSAFVALGKRDPPVFF